MKKAMQYLGLFVGGMAVAVILWGAVGVLGYTLHYLIPSCF